ncbi:twitching motility protein [Plesiocystis pacifica SIR-1]|uniref:Twitching motility protein n=1 Tax=Plesiocystis pacifica SIR-1 TaxID=391625 RepID=A6FYD3_9BACT|nr:type IV pilus twitching motility protein PilT [Plesiocystis pacifica]EDM81512.1 twitching motility protein [Plesiocystis pacifica SIR-1]
MAQVNLHQLLKAMLEQGATDLHVTMNSPPMLRLDGRLVPLRTPPFSADDSRTLCYSILSDKQKHRFEESLELDLSFGVKGLARFRANLYMQKGAVAGAFRLIPYEIRTFETLGLPEIVRELARKPRGLVLVTGPTGSGKSTTLAAMLDMINKTRREHIITLEDPIEYIHNHQKCLVNQREIGADSDSFSNALKSILRQDPDVVLIGEMRDPETISAALTVAETGHLTFGTLHTNSALQTINRIIDVFPPHQQSQIRAQLSFVLEGVLCQALLPKKGGGRALSLEVMVPTPAIRNLMREDKVHQIYSQMQVGQGEHGMQTFNQSLAELVLNGTIERDIALKRSSQPQELISMLKSGKGLSQVQRKKRDY